MKSTLLLRPRLLAVAGCVLALILAACGVDDTEVDPASQAPVEDELTEVLPAPAEPDESIPSETTTRPTTAPAEATTTVATTTSTIATTTTTTTIPDIPLARIGLGLELVATLNGPVGLVARPGSSDLFVVEQQGRIVRLPNGRSEGADTTLDIRGNVSRGNEQGLLGMAFSPDGDTIYTNHTDGAGDTQIIRWDMSGTTADPNSGEPLLTVDQPRGNHNGGQLAFGPDGFLYIGMGDGGGSGDPGLHGQNPNTLLGSILRIDVSGDDGYVIPPSNPFVDGEAPEVFIWGIRNAWRFGFDQVTGDLWIGDVGQDRFEEISVLRSADGGGNGANLGWNAVEGPEPFRGAAVPDGHVGPVISYGHGSGRCSITGGDVYRGDAIPALHGTYLYGDFCSGEVFGYRVDGSVEEVRLDIGAIDRLSSFGIDNNGEMFAVSGGGGVFRIVAG